MHYDDIALVKKSMYYEHYPATSTKKFHLLCHKATCINEDVRPSYSTNCSVSTKFAVAPSRFAPLLHILVPAMSALQFRGIIVFYKSLMFQEVSEKTKTKKGCNLNACCISLRTMLS
jgi:hypothetical protein